MLEKDFNELDNDFITLWSNILLLDYEDEASLIKKVKQLNYLAELGQINAFQSLLLFNLDFTSDCAIEKFNT